MSPKTEDASSSIIYSNREYDLYDGCTHTEVDYHHKLTTEQLQLILSILLVAELLWSRGQSRIIQVGTTSNCTPGIIILILL